ncbi:AAA family ATPase, partial [Thermus scotoductus]
MEAEEKEERGGRGGLSEGGKRKGRRGEGWFEEYQKEIKERERRE